ncbi:2OG-Fe(II) oxygenase [bacterium]|nr:2OG-Fe(II) oxygenase [bacterium]
MVYNIREDFIGVFNQACTQQQCDSWIRFFKNAQKAGMVVNRQNSENVSPFSKDDLSTTANGNHLSDFIINSHPEIAEVYTHSSEFTNILMNQCLREYCRRFPGLAGFPDAEKKLSIQDTKIQKTVPGQGYHVWHHEHGTSGRAPRRLLAFSLYLNDVEEGGETEFLYQKIRFKPVMGQMLIWPAYFTHAHRGNQPLSGEKYIITGWIEK